jgi:hypothetical protein
VNRLSLRRGGVETFLLGGVALLLLAMAFKSGGVVLGFTAVLVVCVSIAVIARLDLAHLGLIATCLFVFTCSWTAFYLPGHLRPRSILILLSLMLLIAAHMNGRFPRFPWWYTTFIGTVVFVMFVKLAIPTSRAYLDARYLESQAGIWGPNVLNTHISDVGTGIRFLLTLVGAGLTISICALHFRRAPLLIAISYAAGASLSGFVAFVDSFLGLGIGRAITHVGFRGNRATGFADHPVIMSGGNVYAIAIAVWLTTTALRRQRMIGFALLPGLVLGTYAGRSRGGEICLLLAVGLCLLILPKYRRHLHTAALIAGGGIVAMFVLFPHIGTALLTAMRLHGNSGSSDTGRIAVIHQGIHDWEHSPVIGIGLHVMTEAHNVTVQTLASGGLILFFGFVCVQLGGIVTAYNLIKVEPMAAALFATVITGVAFGNLENTLTEPFVYVPVALIVALYAQQHAQQDQSADAPAPLRTPTPRRDRKILAGQPG